MSSLIPEDRSVIDNDSGLSRVVDVIADKSRQVPWEKQWIKDNITSLQEAVREGKHETLYYPAHGFDILRPLIAYDASQLIAVDSDNQLRGRIQQQLEQLGVSFTTETSSDDSLVTTSFNWQGKDRRVTEVFEDARQFNIQELGLAKVDVLHVYLPTGADQDVDELDLYFKQKYPPDEWMRRKTRYQLGEIPEEMVPAVDPETGKYQVIHKAIENRLTQQNYDLVSEGGFFCFDERGLSPYKRAFDAPHVLFEMAGLQEKGITRRYPWTVRTSFVPSKADVQFMDRAGVIYHKERGVSPQTLEAFNHVISVINDTGYNIEMFGSGEFDTFVHFEDGEKLGDAVLRRFNDLDEGVERISGEFQKAGIKPQKIKQFKDQMTREYKQSLLRLQQSFKSFLEVLGQAGNRLRQGEVNQSQFWQELGIEFGQSRYDTKSRRWPFAPAALLGNKEQAQNNLALIREFTQLEFGLEE